jgi:hypothetical protein
LHHEVDGEAIPQALASQQFSEAPCEQCTEAASRATKMVAAASQDQQQLLSDI